MSAADAGAAARRSVSVAGGAARIAFDRRTGLLTGLWLTGERASSADIVATTVAVTLDGREERDPFGGMGYAGAVRATRSELLEIIEPGQPHTRPAPGPVVVRTKVDGATLEWSYRIGSQSPRLRLDLEVLPERGRVVRNVDLSFSVPVDATETVLDAPGNRMRPGLPVGAVTERLVVNTAGGTPGSSGLVVIGSPAAGSVVFWPLASQAIGEQWVDREADRLVVGVSTGIAGEPAPGEGLRYGPVHIDALPMTWQELKPELPEWYERVGLRVPDDSPRWTRTTSIYEVQIGRSLFGGIADYHPYPTVDALASDLERIDSLGFDTLQIMPRQPFPSYNVVDYADITTSYGDAEDLRSLVDAAHRRGMRVILDVIMHGVLDRGSIRMAADGVRNGPHGPFLQSHRSYSVEDAASLPRADHVPWSRHILEFEEAWHDGSPESHPLLAAHPDWFFRDSVGRVMGIYTWAFELGDPGWQRYFERSLLLLVERLGIDGFRFDAPTYNRFPNWSPATRRHASASELAAIQLFARLRARLKADRPDLMFYTEPSGVLLRQSMDLNYNYDEHAQLEDLMHINGSALGAQGSASAGLRNAHDLMRWFEDRNASLPPGAVTAHHIDSHDTFWWGRPGLKWRREQLGIAGARALLSVFALSGGPYMTFVGGELGMEEHVRRVHRLRHRREFADGEADFSAVVADHASVYTVTRVAGQDAAVVVVNLSAGSVTTRLECAGATLPELCRDAMTGEILRLGSTPIVLGPYQTMVVEPVARPAR